MSALASSRLGLRKLQLGSDDGPILIEATLVNLNWGEARFNERDVLTTPEFVHYARVDLERGDFGLVAAGEAGWVGVVWVLFLPATDPGYGFMGPRIGELSVCVQQFARSSGLGRELVSDAISIARERGHEAISLSVESGNPARNLYESMGFADVDVDTLPGTMMLNL